MSKRDKSVAKIWNELKAKEASLKVKIKNTTDEVLKYKLTDELYIIQWRLLRGAPFTQKEGT
jgi:hypothetical protein